MSQSALNGTAPHNFDFLKDVDVRLSVELGRAQMPLHQVMELGEESIVMLDRLSDEPLDVMINGKLIARGEVVAQGNRFGLRILEMAGDGAAAHSSGPRHDPVPDAAPAKTGATGGNARGSKR